MLMEDADRWQMRDAGDAPRTCTPCMCGRASSHVHGACMARACRYAEIKREHDEHMLRAAEAAGRAEALSAELRSECRLRSFEAERYHSH